MYRTVSKYTPTCNLAYSVLYTKMEGECQCLQKERAHWLKGCILCTLMWTLRNIALGHTLRKKSFELVHSAGDLCLKAMRKRMVRRPAKEARSFPSFGELLWRPLIWNVLMYLHVLIFRSQVPGVSYYAQEKAFLAVTVDSYHHLRTTKVCSCLLC